MKKAIRSLEIFILYERIKKIEKKKKEKKKIFLKKVLINFLFIFSGLQLFVMTNSPLPPKKKLKIIPQAR